ncbi:uncharacterized protein LOC122074627 [Macadamia integrifolia]|uniref:uncharacterized protein LOC122074627 n=1 Tax=Macadamia integrifolia TaxID=60698 RepID=UPI001C4ED080|nr:uncharacterized protein LOC122074627 [Macadamia integrifolia]
MKGTLAVCRLVAMKQWESEMHQSTLKGSTRVLVYDGPFVLTTYSTIGAEYRNVISLLHSAKWERIILDEVHFLQITPYSYLFCMECDCKSLEFRALITVAMAMRKEKTAVDHPYLVVHYQTAALNNGSTSHPDNGEQVWAFALGQQKILWLPLATMSSVRVV